MGNGDSALVDSNGAAPNSSDVISPLLPDGKDSDGNDAKSSESPVNSNAIAANHRPSIRKFRAGESLEPEVSNKKSVEKGG